MSEVSPRHSHVFLLTDQLVAGLRFSVHQLSEQDTAVKFDLQIQRCAPTLGLDCPIDPVKPVPSGSSGVTRTVLRVRLTSGSDPLESGRKVMDEVILKCCPFLTDWSFPTCPERKCIFIQY